MFPNRFFLFCLTICFCSGQREKNCTVVPKICVVTKYRSFDGSCNNLEYPDWGMSFTRFQRLLRADYGDGISSYRTAKSGKELPNARKISEIIYPDKYVMDPKFTLSLMQYGQIVTHDMAMIFPDRNRGVCCTSDLQFNNQSSSNCNAIVIPPDDPYYSKKGAKCFNFIRVVTDKDQGCGEDNKPVEQLTRVNSYLDLSIIYGNAKNINDPMRSYEGGLLKIIKDKGQDWPLKSINSSVDCPLSSTYDLCFYASDPRMNQNPQLTLLHIIFYREHNRLARGLAEINPQWNDDTLFEEARKINIAQHQWISFYEWLPLFLNRTTLLQHKIIYNSPTRYIGDYDPKVDPSVLSEHNNAAFRVHTQVAGHLFLVEEDRRWDSALRLSDWFTRPRVLGEKNYFTLLARGLTTQMSLASDEYHDTEITQFWLRRGELGLDLKAIDIQRSRDVGLQPYNKIRALCNLSVAKTFQELRDIPKATVDKLAQLYETPDDIDMIVGGSLEYLAPGALVGPTFQCILLKQFLRTRVGDRFWFERSGGTGFTLNQLNEIRNKTRLARLLCDNTNDVNKMQLKAFEKLDPTNPLKPCEALPSLNLTLWKY